MSNATPRSDYEKFRDEQLKDPLVRAAYEDARARNSLVDRLVRRRHFLRLTQREVAREMGVGQPTISGFETEDSDPRLSTLLRYARAVHATLWIELIPNRARLEVYTGDLHTATEATHKKVTDRARTWDEARHKGAPYLEAVS